MRILAVVLGAFSVSALAQMTPVQALQEDAPSPPMQAFKTAPDAIAVSPDLLRGMAEAEPDIVAPEGVTDAGVVGLRVLVSKTGAMQEAIAYSGPVELRKAAADGVMGWSYRPYRLNGELWEVQSTILLDFRNGVGKRAVMDGVAGMGGSGQGSTVRRGTVRVSSGTAASMAVDRPAPVYPPIAKAAHVQGVVILHAVISRTGDIADLQVISGPLMLQAAAMDAVRKWKFRSYLLNGEPTEVETTINVNFKITEPPPPPPAMLLPADTN